MQISSAFPPQGSPEWRQSKLGCVSASRVADVVAKTKSGAAASRANYMAELLIERLTSSQAEHFHSRPMMRGLDEEPAAREAYARRINQEIAQTGFVLHPCIEQSGASPDGLIGEDGLVQFKIPHAATHLESLLFKSVPLKYQLQVQWEMACTGRKWCDFVSYDPRFPESMQFFVKRIERDSTVIKHLEAEVSQFLLELKDKMSELKWMYPDA